MKTTMVTRKKAMKEKDKDKIKKENHKNVLSAANSQDKEKKENKDNDGGMVGISSGLKPITKLTKREKITPEESRRVLGRKNKLNQ